MNQPLQFGISYVCSNVNYSPEHKILYSVVSYTESEIHKRSTLTPEISLCEISCERRDFPSKSRYDLMISPSLNIN